MQIGGGVGLDLPALPGPQMESLLPPPHPDLESVFTERWCWVLAHKLNEQTGWPMVVVSDGPDGKVGWVHAGVRAPDGRIIDYYGAHEPGAWIDAWAESIHVEGLDGNDMADLGWDWEVDGDKINVYPWDELDPACKPTLASEPPPAAVMTAAVATATKLLARLRDEDR